MDPVRNECKQASSAIVHYCCIDFIPVHVDEIEMSVFIEWYKVAAGEVLSLQSVQAAKRLKQFALVP